MTELTGKAGFASPIVGRKVMPCRILGVELFATLALVISLIVAATAVSIGVARAQPFGDIGRHSHASYAVALLFGAVMVGMGGLTAIVAGQRQTPGE
jgi:predicted acylesterase/phospholipase RssA